MTVMKLISEKEKCDLDFCPACGHEINAWNLVMRNSLDSEENPRFNTNTVIG